MFTDMTDNPSAILARIDARLAQLDKTRAGASLEAGLSNSAIRNLARKAGRVPRVDTLMKLASVLQVDPNWLLTGEGELGQVEPRRGAADLDATSKTAKRKPRSEVEPADVALPLRSLMPRDVPVYGTAAGSIVGAFEMDGIVDYVRRPPAVMAAPDVYALYITGESMAPAYRPGDLVFVHPGRPVRVGDIVIVQTRDFDSAPIQSYIKELVRRTEGSLRLHQYNPVATIDLSRETVVAVHRVLSLAELFGV